MQTRSWRLVCGLAAVCTATVMLAAQEGRGGGERPREANSGGSGGGLTKFDEFTGKLKLDAKTQTPIVTPIIQDAAKEAAPVAQQLSTLRIQWANALVQNKADAEIKPMHDQYMAATVKMTGIETALFAKVYALLKPNQQSNAGPAFDMMAGWFLPAAPAAARASQRAGPSRIGGGEGGDR